MCRCVCFVARYEREEEGKQRNDTGIKQEPNNNPENMDGFIIWALVSCVVVVHGFIIRLFVPLQPLFAPLFPYLYWRSKREANRNMVGEQRVGESRRRLMHLVPAPAVRLLIASTAGTS